MNLLLLILLLAIVAYVLFVFIEILIDIWPYFCICLRAFGRFCTIFIYLEAIIICHLIQISCLFFDNASYLWYNWFGAKSASIDNGNHSHNAPFFLHSIQQLIKNFSKHLSFSKWRSNYKFSNGEYLQLQEQVFYSQFTLTRFSESAGRIRSYSAQERDADPRVAVHVDVLVLKTSH